MTRAELRDQAIRILAGTNFDYQKPAHARAFSELPATIRLMLIEKMTAAFDAAGAAGFKVVGPEATDEMERAANELPHNSLRSARFYAMLDAGDLTRKP